MATVTIREQQQRLDEVSGEARTVDVKSVPYVVPADVALALPPAIPARMLLGSLGDGRLRVVVPLEVAIQAEEGHIIAEAHAITEFGFGSTFAEAIRDLQRAVVELYFRLEAEQGRLGADLDRVWRQLNEALRRRP